MEEGIKAFSPTTFPFLQGKVTADLFIDWKSGQSVAMSPDYPITSKVHLKGLEFDHVILARPLDDIEAQAELNEKVIQNKTLLYVAAKRPRKSLLVCRVIV